MAVGFCVNAGAGSAAVTMPARTTLRTVAQSCFMVSLRGSASFARIASASRARSGEGTRQVNTRQAQAGLPGTARSPRQTVQEIARFSQGNLWESLAGCQIPSRMEDAPKPRLPPHNMSKEDQLRKILDSGIVAIVRSPDSAQLVDVARALHDGGISVLEITMSVPNALDVMRQVRTAFGDKLVLGAGTVLDPETARAVLLAGAEFIVAPALNLEVIRLCQRYDKLVMPGAFTPTEILTAWEAGADIVKVFPADVLGPAFFKAMRGPLPQIRLMPTGGVDLSTASDFLKAGACCLGIGGQLVDLKRVVARDFDGLRELAAKYVEVVRKARA